MHHQRRNHNTNAAIKSASNLNNNHLQRDFLKNFHTNEGLMENNYYASQIDQKLIQNTSGSINTINSLSRIKSVDNL